MERPMTFGAFLVFHVGLATRLTRHGSREASGFPARSRWSAGGRNTPGGPCRRGSISTSGGKRVILPRAH
jgi:hypothetical protein